MEKTVQQTKMTPGEISEVVKTTFRHFSFVESSPRMKTGINNPEKWKPEEIETLKQFNIAKVDSSRALDEVTEANISWGKVLESLSPEQRKSVEEALEKINNAKESLYVAGQREKRTRQNAEKAHEDFINRV